MVTTTRRSTTGRSSSRTASRARTGRTSQEQGVDIQRRFEELMTSLRELFTSRGEGNGTARRTSRRAASSTTRSRAGSSTGGTRSRKQTKRS